MTENQKDVKRKKLRRGKGKIDTPSLIFFSIMAIGLVVLTVIILTKPSSKIYSTTYGDDVTISVEVYNNNKVDVAVDIDSNRVVQSGTYKELDDGIDNNYEVEFTSTDENGKEITTEATIVINEDELTLTYPDGSSINLKESK